LTLQENLEEAYENDAENYKEAVQDGRKIAVAQLKTRLFFYDTRLAELGET
jgi:hypothetical protein